jgi:hypothetical protein
MYTVTLTVRSFQIGYVITVYFNLEIKQFDIMNAFVNTIKSLKGLLVIYKLLPSFERPGYIVKVNCALYGLRDSLAL